MYLIWSILIILVNQNYYVYSQSHHTTCAESQKLFADLCFSPTPYPVEELDVTWLLTSQPEGGWYNDLGNDVFRDHSLQLLQGKELKPEEIDEDASHFCMRTSFGSNDEGNIVGNVSGFGDLKMNYICNYSNDVALLQKCDLMSELKSKYHEYGNFYVVYSNNKNYYINILCYATGQVGWNVHSVSKLLTEEEKEQINKRVESLGFKRSTTVSLFHEKCP